MWHLAAAAWQQAQKAKAAECWVQEELIFPPIPDRKNSIGYYTSKDGAFVEHAKRHNPTCIEYYTKSR